MTISGLVVGTYLAVLLVLAWVFVPFYAKSLIYTMPEFLEKRFSERSRYVLSIVSLVTFVVSKIAVGIFAGGVVFAALMPEVQIHLGSHVIDSFWIGSVIVVSVGSLVGSWLRSKNATRPTLPSPWNIVSPPVNRPREVTAMARTCDRPGVTSRR